jgi:mitotic spindle assembly checkpoint protein MAD2B
LQTYFNLIPSDDARNTMPPPPPPAPASAEPTTYLALVAHFLDFLTVAVHTLLHHRALYPPESFLAARAYGCPVRQSRHRGVCDWVNAAVDAVEGQLLRCAVERVALVVFAPRTGEPLERFIFDLAHFPRVAPQDRHVPFARRGGGGGGGGDEEEDEGEGEEQEEEDCDGERALRPGNLAEQLRGALSAVAFLPRRLAPLPPGCTFNLVVELRDDAEAPLEHPQPWVPVAPSLQRDRPDGEGGRAEGGADLGGVLTTPVRAVESGEMAFEMWVEETRGKMELLRREEGESEGEERDEVAQKKTDQAGASAKRSQERGRRTTQRRGDSAHDSDEFSDLSF